MKKLKQLFLIPSLIIVLVCISLNQQDIFIADDIDFNIDAGGIKIKTPDGHSNDSCLALVLCILSKKDDAPALMANGNTSIFTFFLDHNNSLSGMKNNSPPIGAAV